MSEQPPPVPGAEPTAPPVAAEEDWQRFHPLTPVVRGGLLLVGLLTYLLSQQVDRIGSLLTGGGEQPGDGDPSMGHPWLALGALALVLLAVVTSAAASWWFSRFRLGRGTLELRTGFISRNHRQVRYDRIQAVELIRPLLARLTGLTEVRVESAGGGDSHVSLAYLRHGEAEEMRARLLDLAARDGAPVGETSGGDVVVPTAGQAAGAATAGTAQDSADRPLPAGSPATGRPILQMPVARLVASTLLSAETIFVLLMIPVLLAVILGGLGAAVTGFVPFVLLAAVRSVRRVITWHGLEVVRTGEALRITRGLTDQRSSSVPLRRVQAVELSQSRLWRRAGWWSVSVNVAGAKIGGDSGSEQESVLVPVGTRTEVEEVLAHLVPHLDEDLLAAALDSTREAPGFRGAPRRARFLAPFAWRRTGVAVTEHALLSRSGWWGARTLQVVPHGRIQSTTLSQGPLQRLAGVVDLSPISTVGPVSPKVRHLAEADGERLLLEENERAATARRGSRTPVRPAAACAPAPQALDLPGMSTHAPEQEGRTS